MKRKKSEGDSISKSDFRDLVPELLGDIMSTIFGDRSISEDDLSPPMPPNDESEEISSTPNKAAKALVPSKTGSNDEKIKEYPLLQMGKLVKYRDVFLESPKPSQSIIMQSISEEKILKELESSTDSSSSSEGEEEEETEREDEFCGPGLDKDFIVEEHLNSETSTGSSSSSEEEEDRRKKGFVSNKPTKIKL
ncbi:hypothetical protein ACTXT7_003793 [Hymenolepis weldensis]